MCNKLYLIAIHKKYTIACILSEQFNKKRALRNLCVDVNVDRNKEYTIKKRKVSQHSEDGQTPGRSNCDVYWWADDRITAPGRQIMGFPVRTG